MGTEMSDDIIQRLQERHANWMTVIPTMIEAASEIEALRKRVTELEAALSKADQTVANAMKLLHEEVELVETERARAGFAEAHLAHSDRALLLVNEDLDRKRAQLASIREALGQVATLAASVLPRDFHSGVYLGIEALMAVTNARADLQQTSSDAVDSTQITHSPSR
jgi:chromosome segregation ATPase